MEIAVFHQNDSYGEAGLAGVRRAMQPLGLEPLAIGKVERNSTDVAAALDAIMTQRPEAIVQIGAYKACVAFIRQARKKAFRAISTTCRSWALKPCWG
jgi:ABC-type branched-subunit amino acid transport system substrate-binding protein